MAFEGRKINQGLGLDPKYLKKQYSNPLNWTGGKHRYLSDLFSVLPSDKNLKVLDPFVGGGDLISKLPKSWSVDAGDLMGDLISIHQGIQLKNITVDSVKKVINKFKLSNSNSEGYLKLRDEYNKLKHSSLLYTLICHSNTNRMRFNDSGLFNMPFGERTFNSSMIKKLENYQSLIGGRKVDFVNSDFRAWDFKEYDLKLIDNPYLGTVATYNERNGWNPDLEKDLHNKIDDSANNSRFVLFGQTYSNGKHNNLLEDFSKKYNCRVLKTTTDQCSANKIKGKGQTIEVMVWN